MQLFFEVASVFGTTVIGGLSLYLLLRWCLRFFLKNQLLSARSEAVLYRPKTGHLYGFALLGTITAVLLGYFLAGNPIYGLPAIPIICLLSLPIVSFQNEQRRFRSERSALNFLHGLHGLTQGGIALPTAINLLTAQEKDALEVTLQKKLRTFSNGRSIREILSAARKALALRSANACFSAIEVAYERGLPIDTVLSDALPAIEAEADMFKKTGNLRRTVALQAILASILPWLILWVVYLFQPEIIREFVAAPFTAFIVGFVILWTGSGVSLLWKTSEYY